MKFLRMHGSDEKQHDVREKCALNEPKHGEVWASISKDPKNAGKSVEEVLDMVVDLLE